jgi:hypothetical protein
MRSASTSELPKKLFPERKLILPSLKDPESLNVQIETVRLRGANTNNPVKNLLQMFENLLRRCKNFER